MFDTLNLLRRASAALLDPEQTAVAPGVQHHLGTLLANLTHQPTFPAGTREVAVAIIHHEHERITAEPEKPALDGEANEQDRTADLLDSLATSFGHGNVPGMSPESEDAAFQFLIALRDDVRAGRAL